jgi:hypothetical protein
MRDVPDHEEISKGGLFLARMQRWTGDRGHGGWEWGFHDADGGIVIEVSHILVHENKLTMARFHNNLFPREGVRQ